MTLIAGPCVVEDYVTLEQTLQGILEVIKDKDIDFCFKASVLKDNRTKTDNYRSVNTFFNGLRYLRDVAREYNVSICTDFHNVEQIKEYAKFVDIIQIPAFLSRQVSLLEAAAMSSCPTVHVKKMQSMPPTDVHIPVEIIKRKNPDKEVIITDRGTLFGYNDLMFDPRHIPIMKEQADKVLVDITHMNKSHSRWYWEHYKFHEVLASSAMASGADGLFIETHICPNEAMCDAKTQLTLDQFKKIIENICTDC